MGHRDQGRSSLQATSGSITKDKSKSFPKREKTKTDQPMSRIIQFEDRVSRSRASTKENPRPSVCDRLSRTRVSSQRQLPTDHDYAVPTREYQRDQSSLIPATTAVADPALEVQKQKLPHRFAAIDRVTPYQLTSYAWACGQPTGMKIGSSVARALTIDLARNGEGRGYSG
jgi:hypothetical protein